MATKKRSSRILREVHEMASDLHDIGLIDKRRMREFDALCKLDVEAFSPQKIKSLREKLHVCQPSGVGRRPEHECVHRAEVGDRGEAPERPFSEVAQPNRPQRFRSSIVTASALGRDAQLPQWRGALETVAGHQNGGNRTGELYQQLIYSRVCGKTL